LIYQQSYPHRIADNRHRLVFRSSFRTKSVRQKVRSAFLRWPAGWPRQCHLHFTNPLLLYLLTKQVR